uniref:Actin-related protein 3 n=1 Tax=Alexandrium monilatum TaxID=311494 RepID=A0A7S4Q5B9_9DINO
MAQAGAGHGVGGTIVPGGGCGGPAAELAGAMAAFPGNLAKTPPVIIDIGSGFTKLGYAGNIEPQYVIPTVVANSAKKAGSVYISKSQTTGFAETDYYIGDEALARKETHDIVYPVAKGRIDHWDDMERFLQQAIFRNLRCLPEEHLFLLTEPPFNTPENRELTAELMFETFNVKGLHIAVQAVLALYAQWAQGRDEASQKPDLTGLVVDSGDGLTHLIPVADGYVIGSCIQEIKLGGRDVTQFVNDMLQDRKEPVPAGQRMDVARMIKEQHSYISRNVIEEYQKFDQEPGKRLKSYTGVTPKTKEAWTIQIGYERFLAPEIFFNPEIFVDNVTTPLPQVVDNCILQCPIDYRRRLYGNVVLSGGSTSFMHFKERLQRDLQIVVDTRLQQAARNSGKAPEPIDVKVCGSKQRKQQRFAAWLGGSIFAQEPQFLSVCKTKQEYDEVGPACMRGNPMLHC